MARSRIAIDIGAGVADGAALIAVKGGANNPTKIAYAKVLLRDTTATVVSGKRTSAAGTSSATKTPEPINNSAAAAGVPTVVETAWSVAPTLTGEPLLKQYLPGAAGAFFEWAPDLEIPAAGSFVFYNNTGGVSGALTIELVIDD